jgi:hypothetical protein
MSDGALMKLYGWPLASTWGRASGSRQPLSCSRMASSRSSPRGRVDGLAGRAFDLLDNLERDGLAEKLLSNLVGHLHHQLPAQLGARSSREEEALRFHHLQIQDCWDKFLSKSEKA